MNSTCLLRVLLLYIAVSIWPSVLGASWSYHGSTGPTFWASLGFPDCAGSSQSPIDVVTNSVSVNTGLGSITFTGYGTAPPSMTLLNNGHTVRLDFGGNAQISGGGLPGTYKAFQAHLHWGAVDARGSEHTIDGVKYPAELHIVHYNTIYSSAAEAASQPDGLAVLGILLEKGDDANQGLEALLEGADEVKFEGETESVDPFALDLMLPSDLTFIRYSGSLTTPPCSETVVWTLFTDPITIEEDQLDDLRDLHEFPASTPNNPALVDNFRPVQPLNGRTVTANGAVP